MAARGDDQALGGDLHIGGAARAALGGHEGAQTLAQRAVAFRGPILQHRPRRGGKHRLAGLADALHIEQRGVRKTAGKADDAGLAQQLEELPDG